MIFRESESFKVLMERQGAPETMGQTEAVERLCGAIVELQNKVEALERVLVDSLAEVPGEQQQVKKVGRPKKS